MYNFDCNLNGDSNEQTADLQKKILSSFCTSKQKTQNVATNVVFNPIYAINVNLWQTTSVRVCSYDMPTTCFIDLQWIFLENVQLKNKKC